MRASSRKLAREFLRLIASYSEDEVSDALTLIESGELFREPIATLKRTKAENLSLHGLSFQPPPIQDARIMVTARKLEDEPLVLAFLDDLVARKILRNGLELRAFGELLGWDVPKKLPSRSAIARQLLRRLLGLEPAHRRQLIEGAHSMPDQPSSLRAWSDLIVKS